MSRQFAIQIGGDNRGLAATRATGMARHGDVSYVLEGRIYSHGRLELEQMLEKALESRTFADAEGIVRKFVAEADGEFVVAAEHAASGRVLVFNDALGRLPLFSAETDGAFAIGRSVSSVAVLTGLQRPDRLGLATRLLFGYPMDSRTEVAGVSRFAESGLVWLERSGVPVRLSFERMTYGGGEGEGVVTARMIEALGESLVAACRRRVQGMAGDMPTLALSGGFDSRLVACALARANLPWKAITRSDHLVIGRDAEMAGQVAAVLGIPHHLFAAGAITPELAMDLAAIGDGGLGFSLAHMLGFLRNAQAALPGARFLLTGDGGDKTVAPLLPPGRLNTDGEVARLLSAVPETELEACRDLTGVTRQELRAHVAEAFESHPGGTAAEKLRSLLFRQRAGRWLSLGEDRNRTVFWSTSPFYAPEFLALSNQIADAAKQRDRLYLRLLEWFDPRLAALPRPGMGRHRAWDRFLLEGHLQMSRSVWLSGLYRQLKRHPQAPALADAYQDGLRQAEQANRGLWALAGASVIRRTLAHPPSARFRDQLAALALQGSSERSQD